MQKNDFNILMTIYGSIAALAVHFFLVYLGWANPLILTVPHLILISTALSLDYRTTRSIMTPMFFFCLTYAVTILIPLGINYSVLNQILDISALEQGSLAYLVFLISCAIAYALTARNPSDRSTFHLEIGKNIRTCFVIALALGFVGLLIHLYSFSSYTDFSISNLITNPNYEYFYARQDGRNWSAIFSEAFAVLSVIVALILDKGLSKEIKPSKPLIMFGVIGIFISALLSGNKTGFFWPFIGILAIQGFYYKKLRKIGLALISIALLVLLFFTFIWRGAFSSIADMPASLAEYNQIFYFTARTVTEIRPDAEYLHEATSDLLLYLIPRMVWQDKPLELGLTGRYLQHIFISTDLPANRAFSTTGLSEAWMASGYYGIIVSGLLMGLILSWSRSQLIKPESVGKLIYAAYIYGTIYFILRVGFLNVYIYNLLFVYGLTRLMDSISSLELSLGFRARPSKVPLRSE